MRVPVKLTIELVELDGHAADLFRGQIGKHPFRPQVAFVEFDQRLLQPNVYSPWRARRARRQIHPLESAHRAGPACAESIRCFSALLFLTVLRSVPPISNKMASIWFVISIQYLYL